MLSGVPKWSLAKRMVGPAAQIRSQGRRANERKHKRRRRSDLEAKQIHYYDSMFNRKSKTRHTHMT